MKSILSLPMKKSSRLLAVMVCVPTLLLLAGCGGPPMRWRNSQDSSYGQVQLDRDLYECQRENTKLTMSGGGTSYWSVDLSMANQCMAARGWRRVPASN
jgi:hypothetical protein